MSLTYKIAEDGRTYDVSYKELKHQYDAFCLLTDEQFLDKLPEALHLACIIGFLKELHNTHLVSDIGIIHLIAHQMHIPESTEHEVRELRNKFELFLKLA